MAIRRAFHRAALETERLWERIGAEPGRPPILDPYRGYATPDHLVLRGRVLTSLRRTEPDPTHSRWTNFRQMLRLFHTNEVAGVRVVLPDHEIEAESDAEGYLSIHAPRGEVDRPGWSHVTVTMADEAGGGAEPVLFPVLVPHPEARVGVISDIDDTMIRTGAYSLAKNLWTTFTGSTLTRHVFPDAIRLMQALHDGARTPVFYVSSSPWNLHHFLDRLFGNHGLVPGPMFLRDLGVTEDQVIAGSHGSHKGAAIDTILEANPALSFVLIGDTGQHDAHVYRDAVVRHEGRVAAVVLRQPGPGPDGASREAMEEIGAAGVPVLSDRDFAGIEARLLAALALG